MRRSPCLIFGWVLFAALLGAQIPSPAEHFGHAMGADQKLLTWKAIVEYLRLVDEKSDRVNLRELGRTTEDRPFVLLEISSPENLKQRDDIMMRQKRLAEARFADAAEREAFVKTTKGVVFINCCLHSTEIASSLMVPELVWTLATAKDDETREILDRVVCLITPSANPDGIDIVHDWYQKTIGTPWEGTSPPVRYQKYIGHDNNRDWYMLSQPETRHVTRVLYKEWFPAVFYDVHQMGNGGARLFVPPFTDPVNPNLDPLLQKELGLFGTYMAQELARAEKSGVIQGISFDNWWNGGARNVPYRHNMIGILSEAASAKLASPIFQNRSDLKGHGNELPEYKAQTNFPDPWPGGWWRLRDIVEYELISARAILKLTARMKDEVNSNYALLGERAKRRGVAEPPSAWVIPGGQKDQAAVRRLVANLLDTGVELGRAREAFVADGVEFPKGTYVIPANQAYRAHAKDLLERQEYPEIKASADGPIIRPYDNAGWTLPAQFGIDCRTITEPFNYPGDTVTAPDAAPTARPAEKFTILDQHSGDAYTLVNRLLQANVPVRRAKVGEPGIDPMEPGEFLFETPAEADWQKFTAGLVCDVRGIADAPPIKHMHLRSRVGLYEPWTGNLDAGWTLFVLENHGFSPVPLHDARMRTEDLAANFDALVVASMSAKQIRTGNGTADAPPEYQGGLGDEGVENLKRFVERGGTAVFFGQSTTFANSAFELGLTDITDADEEGLGKEEKEARKDLSCPGSILWARFSESVATMAGIGVRTPVFYAQNPVFSPKTSGLLGAFEGGDPLISGYLRRPKVVAGGAVMIEKAYGRGKVVLFSFRPQNRGQSLGTFRLIFEEIMKQKD